MAAPILLSTDPELEAFGQQVLGDAFTAFSTSKDVSDTIDAMPNAPEREELRKRFLVIVKEAADRAKKSGKGGDSDDKDKISKALAAALDIFQDLNGDDAYSVESIATGRLAKNHMMAIPSSWNPPEVNAKDVGSAAAALMFNMNDIVQIYALNKARCPDAENAIKYALLRVEAAKAGWLTKPLQREVLVLSPVDTQAARATFLADFPEMEPLIKDAKMAAYVVPFAAEHTFRTMGHHFITADAATYVDRYKRTLNACLLGHLATFMPPALLYHAALHWIGPSRVREVCRTQIAEAVDRIPEAIKIRAHAPPAGVALITTTAAVVVSLKGTGMDKEFATKGKFDLAMIDSLTERIKLDPARFHKTPYAYNLPALTANEVKEVESAKKEAAAFAPIAQAYIEAYLRNADMSNARALVKHADANPIMKSRAAAYFKRLAKREIDSLEDLFSDSTARPE